MDGYDSDMNTEYTIIIESPIPAEGPILSASTGRKDGSVCEGSQTEGRRDITGPDDVLLSAPLWTHRKFSDLEGRLDKLECTVGSLKSTHLYIIIQLEALDKRVDDLEKDEIRDAIKGVRDDISSLRRANDETLMHLDEEIERARNGFTTKRGDISVSLSLGFSNFPNNPATN